MLITTSSFFDTLPIVAGRISIATFVPTWASERLKHYRALAPEQGWLELPREECIGLYQARLAALDADAVVADVRALVYPHAPILLCWEKRADIEAGKAWCHRHLVAAWIEHELGIEVPELGASKAAPF
jgi:hypothetical protein